MPAPIRAGRFGMVRTTGTPAPSQRARSARRIPAATDTTIRRRVASSSAMLRAASAICCGFTASTTTSASRTAAVLSVVTRTPKSNCRRSSWAGIGSATHRCPGVAPRAHRPPTRLVDMWPPPMKAIRIGLVSSFNPGVRTPPCRSAPCVAPSSTAASKSPLMPMDSVSSAWPRVLRSSSRRRKSREGHPLAGHVRCRAAAGT